MEKEHRLELDDGRTLACLELGEPSGLPVIYLHGYPGSRLEARLVAGAIQKLNLRLIAPDRPGFGESTFHPGRTLSSTAADIRVLADRLELGRFAVIGMSGGGPHALACGVHIPERVGRLALVGGLGPTTQPDLVAEMIAPHRLALAAGLAMPRLTRLSIALVARTIRRYPRRFLAFMLKSACPADQAVLADGHYRQLMLESTVEALRQAGINIAHELILLARSWEFGLDDVRVPVTIWQGLDDNIVPAAMARYLAESLPDCELHCLPDEGHLSLIVRNAKLVFTNLKQDN